MMTKKKQSILACLIGTLILSGCGKTETPSTNYNNPINNGNNHETSENKDPNIKEEVSTVRQLSVSFGDAGEAFTMNLLDNETAMAIAHHVGTSNWRLPIRYYDDYENWEVMQYYDIPTRYEIPSNPEVITSEKAGEVYYSEPNRIVLFFHDAEVTGEYTRIGSFDYNEEFVRAVEDNPILEGWGNKIILIQSFKQ